MQPILGRFGPFLFYNYTLFLGLGLVLSVALTAWRVQRRPAPAFGHWPEGLVATLLPALVAGRAGFVGAHWDYFQTHPGESWRLWRGGLTYHGALLGGLLGLFLWCHYRKRSLAAYAELLAPAGALLSACGWAACWLEGCAYGRETFLGPLAADLPDALGVYGVRYQTQLAGLLASLLALLLYWRWQRKLSGGAGFWLVLALLSSGRALIGLYRGDLAAAPGLLAASTIADGSLALLALAAFIYTRQQHDRYRSAARLAAPETKSKQ